ncbi:sugar phosphate isomerase/epimerase family protein [Castellaniella sp.]|uniref:sugar phosphate isomerase/epimerase family protein n=1 Tax=Castellaniella sp. TaxID=1955812 RepID=UPI002AFFD5EE|nr:TIM barrel protein [Castellaniella sp.]
MSRRFSLAHLTALNLNPPDLVDTAAQAGYQAVGLRLLPFTFGGVAYRLMDDPLLLDETLARMRDTGVQVQDIEILRLNETFQVSPYQSFFEIGQRLGAKNILVAGEDRDPNRLIDSFARLCEACKPYGLTADIEFMPWLAVNNLPTARALIEAAGQDNGGVLIDPLHFTRSGSTLDQLADLPDSMVHYAQICDAPENLPTDTAALLQLSRSARLAPGEGAIPLQAMFQRLPQDILISVEIPNEQQSHERGHVAWVRHCLEASRQVLGPEND